VSRALDIAAAILERQSVDQMKLHKLLYFVQAGSLAWFDAPAFEERIEAWTYGPVIRRVAGRYMNFDGDPIPGPVAGKSESLDHRTAWLVERVLAEYGHLSGPELAELTKRTGTPWRKVRADLPEEAPSDREIPLTLLADFHKHHGVFPSVPTQAEEELASRFLEGEPDALADLFETATGVRPIVR